MKRSDNSLGTAHCWITWTADNDLRDKVTRASTAHCAAEAAAATAAEVFKNVRRLK